MTSLYPSVRKVSDRLQESLLGVRQLIKFSLWLFLVLVLASAVGGFSFFNVFGIRSDAHFNFGGDYLLNLAIITVITTFSLIISFTGMYITASSARRAIKLTSRLAERGRPRVTFVQDLKRFRRWLKISQLFIIAYFLLIPINIVINLREYDPFILGFQIMHAAINSLFCVAYWIVIQNLKVFFKQISERGTGHDVLLEDISIRATSSISMAVLMQKIRLFTFGVGMIGGSLAIAFYPEISDLFFTRKYQYLNFVIAALGTVLGAYSIWIDVVVINVLNQIASFIHEASAVLDARLKSEETSELINSYLKK